MSFNRRDLLRGAAAISAGSIVTAEARSLGKKDTHSAKEDGLYQPYWNSLGRFPFLEVAANGKFGIYTHWGIYAVPAYGRNATWYAYHTYTIPILTRGSITKRPTGHWRSLATRISSRCSPPADSTQTSGRNSSGMQVHASPGPSLNITMALRCGTQSILNGMLPRWVPSGTWLGNYQGRSRLMG